MGRPTYYLLIPGEPPRYVGARGPGGYTEVTDRSHAVQADFMDIQRIQSFCSGTEIHEVSKPKVADFTKHRNPCLAVRCPQCGTREGAFCPRPSEHRIDSIHRSRREWADIVFIRQHGPDASIDGYPGGPYTIDPTGYRDRENARRPRQLQMDLEAVENPENDA